MTRPRGPMLSWRPQAKTRALLDDVSAVLSLYSAYLPLTIRQIFYRLHAAHGYEKSDKAYQNLVECLGKARRAKILPPLGTIRDDGVTVEAPEGFHGMPDFRAVVRSLAADYRRDRLDGQTVAVELWCEAAGMVPQLSRVATDYGVPVFSGSGFDSLTAKVEAARRSAGANRPLVVLHVGDHDPSGVHLFSSAAEDVSAWASYFGGSVEFERIAVTVEQIEALDLPTAPPKPSDNRAFRGETCQAEALDPATLATIVREAIESWLDLDVLADLIETEEAERAELIARYAS